MNSLLNVILTTDFAFSVLRVTTPILFAALGALISNRAGIINIGMEGIMLVSALAGVVVSSYTASAWIGLLGAVLSGTAIAGMLAFFTLKFKTHIILGGVAINMFASGGTVFLLYLLSGDKGSSTSLPSKVLPSIDIPLLQQIPVFGPILSGHHILTYASILAVIAVYYLLKRTPLGLQIRSVGENPHAAQSVGVSVVKIQYMALLLSGFFASLGGAYMSMGYLSLFTRDMIAGRGWIAIAAESMGRSTTVGTALTSLLFGGAEALANALQVLKIPAELIGTLPYVATVIGLIVYAIAETRKKRRKLAQKRTEERTMTKPIIIDCDPGHDDAIAILLALANPEQLEIKGITTVGGNQTLEKITNNALKILSFVGADIPVAKGAKGPLLGALVTGEEAHGESGMDGPVLPPSRFRAIEEGAVEFIRNLLLASDEPITLVPIGPLTNIATLIRAYPELKSRIAGISMMGGGIAYGNVTRTAEFNIYVDPEAAQIVFESGIPITMSGLDVTDKAAIFDEEIEALKTRGPVSVMVGELLDFYSIYGKKMGYHGNALHDPCAIAWLLQPQLFQSKMLDVMIETQGTHTRGMTVGDLRTKTDREPNVNVLLDVDRDAFIRLIYDALAILDARVEQSPQGDS